MSAGKKPARPLTAAGRQQAIEEAESQAADDAAAKAAEDPGTVSVSVKAAGWRRGFSVKIVIPPDD